MQHPTVGCWMSSWCLRLSGTGLQHLSFCWSEHLLGTQGLLYRIWVQDHCFSRQGCTACSTQQLSCDVQHCCSLQHIVTVLLSECSGHCGHVRRRGSW